jgi:hypothetical protein
MLPRYDYGNIIPNNPIGHQSKPRRVPASYFGNKLAIDRRGTGAAATSDGGSNPALSFCRPRSEIHFTPYLSAPQFEQIRLAAPLGFAHHRLVAETDIAADQPRPMLLRHDTTSPIGDVGARKRNDHDPEFVGDIP